MIANLITMRQQSETAAYICWIELIYLSDIMIIIVPDVTVDSSTLGNITKFVLHVIGIG